MLWSTSCIPASSHCFAILPLLRIGFIIPHCFVNDSHLCGNRMGTLNTGSGNVGSEHECNTCSPNLLWAAIVDSACGSAKSFIYNTSDAAWRTPASMPWHAALVASMARSREAESRERARSPVHGCVRVAGLDRKVVGSAVASPLSLFFNVSEPF